MTKILLVEDDKSLREIYGVRLLAEGYDIVSAGDGEEALAMAIKERPQLIVSDVMMPKISGFDMLDILRSTTETKDIKVIMMTALSSEDQRARGEALGADRYLVKSQVGIEDVVRAVHEVLADAPVSRPAGPQTFGGNTSAAPVTPGARPAAPVPPRPVASVPQPTGAQPSTPSAAPHPAVSAPEPAAPTGLPRPTAPFSTTRPANLGDRVIHPITQPPSTKPDLGSLMDRELSGDPVAATPPLPPTPPAPQVAPPTPPAAQPTVAPVAPVEPDEPASVVTPPPALSQPPTEPEISFEETPRSDNPQPPNPFAPGPQPPTMS